MAQTARPFYMKVILKIKQVFVKRFSCLPFHFYSFADDYVVQTHLKKFLFEVVLDKFSISPTYI